MILRILAVGDVVGAPGLTFLTERLRAFQEQEHIDFTVVNGENANVVGVTPKQADAIFAAGADVITLGNHTWTRYELQPYLEQKKRILRPANAVLGIAPEQSIGKFLGDPPRRYEAAMGAAKLEGAIFEVDSDTGRCRDVQLVRLR